MDSAAPTGRGVMARGLTFTGQPSLHQGPPCRQETVEGVLFVNGGQGYSSFLVAGTVAWITVEDGVASAEIVEFAPAE